MPAPRQSTMLVWWVVTALLALTVGGLLKLGDLAGLSILRMFATFLLIPVFLAATAGLRIFYALQGKGAVRRTLEENRRALMILEEVPLLEKGPRAQYVVVGPTGVLALIVDSFEPAFLPSGRRFQQNRAVRTAEALDEALRAKLAPLLPPGLPVRGAVAVLRRSAPILTEEHPFKVVDVKAMGELLDELRQEIPPTKPPWYDTLKASLLEAS